MVMTESPVTRSELREEIATIRADVRGEIATLKADVRQGLALLRDEFRQHYATKADLKELELRLMLRLAGLMITGFALVIGAMRLWA